MPRTLAQNQSIDLFLNRKELRLPISSFRVLAILAVPLCRTLHA
jgi:hypothetical protein